jgi:hypothetical protein
VTKFDPIMVAFDRLLVLDPDGDVSDAWDAYINLLHRLEVLNKAIAQIASCRPHVRGDVVDIARAAIKETT